MACHERYKLFFLEGSLILILSIGCVLSKNQPAYTCGAGLSTPGYTFPIGDITLEYGNDLDISCVLHESKAAEFGDNPSTLMSMKWMQRTQSTEIINSTAIKLHVERHPKTNSADYTCLVNGTFVCHNVVVVGTKPQYVTDFKCIGYNYENLTCTWTAPENYVKTDYHLEYITSSRTRFAQPCPNITYNDERKTKLSCTWTFATKPPYRHSHDRYTFRLTANNTFGKNTNEIDFDHFSNVVPNPPENLTGIATSPHSIYLNWLIPVKMQSFPEGIEHRVMWWMQGHNNWTTLPPIIEAKMNRKFMEFNLTDLPYAHWLYDIRVSMRSLKATDESLWSHYSFVTVRTKPKLPDRPPRTDIGSFEIQESRNRIVYWQNIQDYEENGQNFSYHIEVENHPDIRPIKYKNNSNYAKFVNLTDRSYIFKIWSINEIGTSQNYSSVYIPASKEALKPPSKLIKVDKDHGVYDLEWVLSDDPRVTNYTLFWCPDPRERPYQCNGILNWIVVPQGKKNITLELPTINREKGTVNNYQFAISANGHHISSGMLWAECTVIPGRGIKLSQTHFKSVGSRHIIVFWKMDCVKISDIRGFNITYCPLGHSAKSIDCKDNIWKYTTIDDPGAEEGVIDGLTPYTRYKIQIKPILINAESQFSEAIFNTTLEDEPTKPRNLRVINKSDSSLLIQWEKPAEENGVITYYQVSLNGENRHTTSSEKDKIVYEANITNLTSRTVYEIQVEACHKICSKSVIVNETEVGVPGIVPKPSGNWDNDFVMVKWDKPYPTNLKVDYYQVKVQSKFPKGNEIHNTTDQYFLVSHCGKDNKSQGVYVQVKAVNILAGRALPGPWSEQAYFHCFPSQSETWVIILIVISVLVFIGSMIYLVKQLWVHIRRMKNVSVKLPDGLAAAVETYQEKEKHIDDTLPADEPLLSRKFPSGQSRNPSGESSGCCSGTESVSSSVDSAGHLSMTDSGTDQPVEGNVALRQRVNKPSGKKSDYVTMPEIASQAWSPKQTQGGYSVIGMAAPLKKPESDLEYMALSDIPAKTSYVPFPVPPAPEPVKESPLKPLPSGYVPFMAQEPAAKNTDYVLAGVPTKPIIVLPKAPIYTQKEETSSGYVKAPPMTTMEASKLLLPWQQQSVEPPSTGYVVVGDPKPQKGVLDIQKGSKGYVPHNIKFDTTKSLKED